MGFQEQLHEIMSRLPESRQTVLFSATLPKLLVEFARAGLQDPTLIRLDVDTKLSENLMVSFANLIYILTFKNLNFFFLYSFLVGHIHMPYPGATGTPVLDFW